LKIAGSGDSPPEDPAPNQAKAFSSTVNMVLSVLILVALISLIIIAVKCKNKKKVE